MDRLDDMLAFVKVVEQRGFGAAAIRLGVSKSVISRRVAALEDRLGARLLHRTTRQISLTEVGQAFYERCERLLADLAEAEQAVADLHGSLRGTLRISAPMSFGRLHLGAAIPAFLTRHPELTLDIDLNDRFVDLVEERYDLAVRIGRLRDSSLIARKLAPNRLVACASPDYLARHGEPLLPDDLTQHNCLIYAHTPLAEQWQFQVHGHWQSARVNGTLRVNNGDMLCAAAVAGLGIAMLPTFIAGAALQEQTLKAVLLPYTVSDSAVYALYPHSRHLSPKVRAFVDFLAGRFAPEPYWDHALGQITSPAENDV